MALFGVCDLPRKFLSQEFMQFVFTIFHGCYAVVAVPLGNWGLTGHRNKKKTCSLLDRMVTAFV